MIIQPFPPTNRLNCITNLFFSMKTIHHKSLKFCFISNSNQSYLADYINLSRYDFSLDFSFKNINLSELKSYEPNIIVIDEYFKDENYASVIDSIKLNFKHVKIYFLSPEYANYSDIIESVNNKNHYYSNFSVDILDHINSISKNDRSNYLEAS